MCAGVLIQGGTVLPEAKKALARLYTDNGTCLLHSCRSCRKVSAQADNTYDRSFSVSSGQAMSICVSRRTIAADAKLVVLHAGAKPKYPVCFLTNGGGVTEAQKAEQLSGWLDVAVGVDQVAHQAEKPLYCPTASFHRHRCLCKSCQGCS